MDFMGLFATYAAVAPAEITDKTLLLAVLLGSDKRWNRWAVFAGGGLAFVLTMGAASLIGIQATRLPDGVRLGIALVLFVISAAMSAWAAITYEREDVKAKKQPVGSLVGQVVLSTFMLGTAELADKSQLAAVSMAGATGDFWSVLIGSWLAMMTVVGLGLLAARIVQKYVHPKLMLWIGAGFFVLFSLWTAWQLITL